MWEILQEFPTYMCLFDYESMCMYSNEKNMDRTYYFIKLGYVECYQLGTDTTTTRYLVDTFFHILV